MFLAYRGKWRAAPRCSTWLKRFLKAPPRKPSQPCSAAKDGKSPPWNSTGLRRSSPRAKRRAEHALARKFRTSSVIPDCLRAEGDVRVGSNRRLCPGPAQRLGGDAPPRVGHWHAVFDGASRTDADAPVVAFGDTRQRGQTLGHGPRGPGKHQFSKVALHGD